MKLFTHLINKPESVRFSGYCEPVTESGCILWLGEESHNGYGRFRSGGRRIAAHRYAWIKEHGEIPAGLMVCHKCDTPQCVNVSHLFLGTCRENKLDSVSKGRHSRGRVASLARAKFTPEMAMSIFNAKGTHQSIADAFGIGRQSVSKIKAKLQWQWIHDEKQVRPAITWEEPQS